MSISVRLIKENRKEFNRRLTSMFKKFQQENNLKGWPINPDSYTFFSYYDEKENVIIKLICNEN